MNCIIKYIPLLFVLIFFASCEKDNEIINGDPVIIDDTEISTESNPLMTRNSGMDGDGILLECITLLFPFDLVDNGGEFITINIGEDFIAILEDTTIVDFVYPLDILVDEEPATVDSGEELGSLFAECTPDDGWQDGNFPAYEISHENSCIELVYPVNLISPEGITVTAADETEFNDLMSMNFYFFDFPITIINQEEETVEIEDTDGLFAALIGCNGFDEEPEWDTDFHYIECYQLIFPLDYIDQNDEVQTAEDHDEFVQVVLEGDIVKFSYPLVVKDELNNIVIFYTNEDFEAAVDACYDPEEGEWDQEDFENNDMFLLWIGSYIDVEPAPCYTVSFPVSFVHETNGETLTITNADELSFTVFNNNFTGTEVYDAVYPITVTYINDGTLFELTAIEDFDDLYAGCE